MANPVFIQNARIGRTCFQLNGNQLEVTWLNWRRLGKTFPLKTLSFEYERGARRFPMLYVVPGVIASAAIGAITLAAFMPELPEGLSMNISLNLYLYGLMSLAAGIWGVLRGVRRVDYFQFYDWWRRPVFFIVRDEAQSEECEKFIHELLDRIRRIQNDEPEPADEPAPPVSAVRLPASDERFLRKDQRWKIAITMSIIVNALGGIPTVALILGPGQFMLVFAAATGAFFFAVLSFQSKERHRYWAAAAALLSLIPFFT
jgi:hypothetical protein